MKVAALTLRAEEDEMAEPRWRVGRKLGRTLYIDDQCVGMVDTPELAAAIVGSLNGSSEWASDPCYAVATTGLGYCRLPKGHAGDCEE